MQASFDEYTNIQRAVSHAGNIHAWFQRSSNRAIMVAMIASVVPARAEWVPIRDEVSRHFRQQRARLLGFVAHAARGSVGTSCGVFQRGARLRE